ncbi:C-type lectin domain family 2 member D3-like [Tiliqua scincoides]|uniref:C-type lectin domain family 2 member D3-like n=1 Tax=Tiliqua scincoides TaxID=71010 RepID=UPI003463608D
MTVRCLACPANWLNYEGKCYFFSEEERSWTSGQSFCAASDSSMVVLESQPEKVFVLHYMGTTGHWIGLRKDSHQTWKWTDGTEFNNLMSPKGFLSSKKQMKTEQAHTRPPFFKQRDKREEPSLRKKKTILN